MLEEFGLDLSAAVNMFLRQMLREKAIPFELRWNEASTYCEVEF